MSRPTDHLQPSGKRRPGEQLTKDNAGESDEEGPAIDPGTWGKADASTMSRRKVVRARRGAAAAEPTPQVQATGSDQAAGSNPFTGVVLASTPSAAAANPFAGISLVPGKAIGAADEQPAVDKAGDTGDTGGKDTAAHAAPAAAAVVAAAASTEAVQGPGAADAPQQPITDRLEEAEGAAAQACPVTSTAATEAPPASSTAPDDAAARLKADVTNKQDAVAPSAGMNVFGGAAGGFGGFSGFGTTGGFGATGGFGGFAAAAKDGASSGSLFGNYTAPKPGSLFAPVPAFGAARQSDAGEDDAAGGEHGDGEGNEVFGGDSTQPVVQLSEVPKQTGEEDEETIYSADGSLFEFVNGKEWRERGKGELRLNVNSTKQARMVMRQRGSQRLLLNARLHPTMTTSKMVGGKGVTFAAVNAAAASAAAGDAAAGQEGKEKASQEENGSQSEASKDSSAPHVMRTYALKVKNAERIDEFVTAVDQHKLVLIDAAPAAEEQV